MDVLISIRVLIIIPCTRIQAILLCERREKASSQILARNTFSGVSDSELKDLSAFVVFRTTIIKVPQRKLYIHHSFLCVFE